MNCVILDDEPFAHQVLEHYIKETPALTLKANFRNSIEAYEYLSKHKIDLLFLDIEMPLVDGVSFLKALKDPPKTIFTTAHKQYAFEGFELGVVDYLLKPFSFERFTKAVERLLATAEIMTNVETVAIKDRSGLLNLRQQDIVYIEGCKDYIKIVTADQPHVIYHTLKAMFAKLNTAYFIQVHRSYLVNTQYISRLVNDNILLHDKTVIPVGQHYRKLVLDNLNK